MALTPLAVDLEATSLSRFVTDARQLGLDVPKSVDDELKLHRRLTNDPLGTHQALARAQSALHAAPIDKVDAALDVLAEATVQAGAAQALGETVRQIAVARLRHVVYDQLDGWEKQAVEAANGVVEAHKLNAVAADLPDLVALVSPVDLSHTQSRAVQRFREAADLLHPLWRLFTKISIENGHDVGPGGADGLSTNLSLACRLGNP